MTALLKQQLDELTNTRWVDFTQKATAAGFSANWDTPDWQSLKTVFGTSNFLFQTLIRNPKIAGDIIAKGRLHNDLAPDDYLAQLKTITQNVTSDEELGSLLRRFRYKEMARLAWRDLAGYADLAVMMRELSYLAKACLSITVNYLYAKLVKQYGYPVDDKGNHVGPVIMALGKLGANELNFSSDIDLIFSYPVNGNTDGLNGKLDYTSNKDFFTKLFRAVIKLLGDVTRDGFVFRVDARLRPFGDVGELAISFSEMETYYEKHGREWERYAFIKATPAAGDIDAGEELTRRLTPFIFRRYLDYNAFDSLKEMKAMINQDVKRQGMEENVKTGWGGIREVEFFGQVFQLIRGGVETFLRAPQIITVLNLLAEHNNIPEQAKNELLEAYDFLRRTENHLQEMDDRQTHDIPKEPLQKFALAQSMGFSSIFEFDNALYNYRKMVNHHFQKLFEDEMDTPQNGNDNDAAQKTLQGFINDNSLKNLSPKTMERLQKLMPRILAATSCSENPAASLGYILDILKAIVQRANYLALLVASPKALDNLVLLCEASPWVAHFLNRHPVVLDELAGEPVSFKPKTRAELYAELKTKMDSRPFDDEEGRIETMCVFKQTKTLRVVAADVLYNLPLMKVSDYLSDIAEVCIQAAVNMAWKYLVAKHGEPTSLLHNKPCGRGFVVVAYGKLGGLELGYDSDLDLVFLHAADGGLTNGEKSIDNGQFYNRLGQRVVHILTTHTRAGKVYDIDTRLRPSGNSGLLVTHIESFKDYQLNNAWLWEHQALIKARPVFGEESLVDYFEQVRCQVLGLRRPPAKLKQDVIEMRQKMNEALYNPQPGLFDLKYSPGAMVDIEFFVQYLVLRHGYAHKALLQWTDIVRQIQELMKAGILSDELAHILKRAYLLYRATGHKLSLQEKPKTIDDARFVELKHTVTSIWQGIFT